MSCGRLLHGRSRRAVEVAGRVLPAPGDFVGARPCIRDAASTAHIGEPERPWVDVKAEFSELLTVVLEVLAAREVERIADADRAAGVVVVEVEDDLARGALCIGRTRRRNAGIAVECLLRHGQERRDGNETTDAARP